MRHLALTAVTLCVNVWNRMVNCVCCCFPHRDTKVPHTRPILGRNLVRMTALLPAPDPAPDPAPGLEPNVGEDARQDTGEEAREEARENAGEDAGRDARLPRTSNPPSYRTDRTQSRDSPPSYPQLDSAAPSYRENLAGSAADTAINSSVPAASLGSGQGYSNQGPSHDYGAHRQLTFELPTSPDTSKSGTLNEGERDEE